VWYGHMLGLNGSPTQDNVSRLNFFLALRFDFNTIQFCATGAINFSIQ